MKKQYLKATDIKAKWPTARGFGRWARRHIGWVRGILMSGESFSIRTFREEYNNRVYVALIVYGSGDIPVTKEDIEVINFHFNRAVARK